MIASAAVFSDAEVPLTRIDVHYDGRLHTQAIHEPSGSVIETDAPEDNEGLGEKFSPTDLVATALGSCTLTTIGIVAQRHEWNIKGSRARIEKHMTPGAVRRIDRLVVHLDLPGEIENTARKALERAAETCPVHRSLHPDVLVELHFHWGAIAANGDGS